MKYTTRLGEPETDLQKALELMLSVPHRAIDNKFLQSIEGYRGRFFVEIIIINLCIYLSFINF